MTAILDGKDIERALRRPAERSALRDVMRDSMMGFGAFGSPISLDNDAGASVMGAPRPKAPAPTPAPAPAAVQPQQPPVVVMAAPQAQVPAPVVPQGIAPRAAVMAPQPAGPRAVMPGPQPEAPARPRSAARLPVIHNKREWARRVYPEVLSSPVIPRAFLDMLDTEYANYVQNTRFLQDTMLAQEGLNAKMLQASDERRRTDAYVQRQRAASQPRPVGPPKNLGELQARLAANGDMAAAQAVAALARSGTPAKSGKELAARLAQNGKMEEARKVMAMFEPPPTTFEGRAVRQMGRGNTAGAEATMQMKRRGTPLNSLGAGFAQAVRAGDEGEQDRFLAAMVNEQVAKNPPPAAKAAKATKATTRPGAIPKSERTMHNLVLFGLGGKGGLVANVRDDPTRWAPYLNDFLLANEGALGSDYDRVRAILTELEGKLDIGLWRRNHAGRNYGPLQEDIDAKFIFPDGEKRKVTEADVRNTMRRSDFARAMAGGRAAIEALILDRADVE